MSVPVTNVTTVLSGGGVVVVVATSVSLTTSTWTAKPGQNPATLPLGPIVCWGSVNGWLLTGTGSAAAATAVAASMLRGVVIASAASLRMGNLQWSVYGLMADRTGAFPTRQPGAAGRRGLGAGLR